LGRPIFLFLLPNISRICPGNSRITSQIKNIFRNRDSLEKNLNLAGLSPITEIDERYRIGRY
jgi:hypothetical protein